MKKVLFIAYHFPPVKISSAVQRTLKFSKYLEQYDWQSLVLTINSRAAIKVSQEQVNEIPKSTIVKHCFALDTAKHLSIRGKYFKWMSTPDRWSTWIPFAIINGLILIKKYQPNIILSTYPIPSTHLIGLTLHKITGIPWVADFRDSMTDDVFPSDYKQKKVYRWIEKKTILNCTKAIFTTQGTLDMYANRYPELSNDHWDLIPNGYDEENFKQANSLFTKHKDKKKITLLHSGVIYPSERDPIPFFSAISYLKNKQLISNKNLSIHLRATGHDLLIKSLIDKYDISDIVTILPTISYQDALAEMLSCNGLIIFQASSCNHQIPAKIYEYLRAQKPILALTDKMGDTANLLLSEGLNDIVPIDNKEEIVKSLLHFINNIQSGNFMPLNISDIEKYSRKSQTIKLAKILNTMIPPYEN